MFVKEGEHRAEDATDDGAVPLFRLNGQLRNGKESDDSTDPLIDDDEDDADLWLPVLGIKRRIVFRRKKWSCRLKIRGMMNDEWVPSNRSTLTRSNLYLQTQTFSLCELEVELLNYSIEGSNRRFL